MSRSIWVRGRPGTPSDYYDAGHRRGLRQGRTEGIAFAALLGWLGRCR